MSNLGQACCPDRGLPPRESAGISMIRARRQHADRLFHCLDSKPWIRKSGECPRLSDGRQLAKVTQQPVRIVVCLRQCLHSQDVGIVLVMTHETEERDRHYDCVTHIRRHVLSGHRGNLAPCSGPRGVAKGDMADGVRQRCRQFRLVVQFLDQFRRDEDRTARKGNRLKAPGAPRPGNAMGDATASPRNTTNVYAKRSPGATADNSGPSA